MTAAGKKADDDSLTVGLAQIAPVWLNREKTLAKVVGHVEQAAAQGCRHGVGLPLLDRGPRPRFNPREKELHRL